MKCVLHAVHLHVGTHRTCMAMCGVRHIAAVQLVPLQDACTLLHGIECTKSACMHGPLSMPCTVCSRLVLSIHALYCLLLVLQDQDCMGGCFSPSTAFNGYIAALRVWRTGVCACVCVCVCERERKFACARACVCTCLHKNTCIFMFLQRCTTTCVLQRCPVSA
jgi:hypothetical protein